jgi:hypothetical protein
MERWSGFEQTFFLFLRGVQTVPPEGRKYPLCEFISDLELQGLGWVSGRAGAELHNKLLQGFIQSSA